MTDQQLLIAAIRKAAHIIAEHHLEPGARDANETISRLIAVLENGGQGSRAAISVSQWKSSGTLEAGRMCSLSKRQEKIVPVLLLWAVPASIFVDSTACYLAALAELLDSTGAIALAQSTATPPDQRRKFTVIEGGLN